jgi:uncharacterized lipoprotein NlpE involved in copper resistance
MKKQIGIAALAALLCGCNQNQAEKHSPQPAGQLARDEAQQLLKERNEALPKAQAAEKKMREVGKSSRSLGFEQAKTLRDKEAAFGDKATAFSRYATTARDLEKKIKTEVMPGKLGVGAADIAVYERLQAEVDLARLQGRLPAPEQ